MSQPSSQHPDPGDKPGSSPRVRKTWLERRQERITKELERNRQGDYRVPTWVLTVGLLVIIAAWAAVIVFG